MAIENIYVITMVVVIGGALFGFEIASLQLIEDNRLAIGFLFSRFRGPRGVSPHPQEKAARHGRQAGGLLISAGQSLLRSGVVQSLLDLSTDTSPPETEGLGWGTEFAVRCRGPLRSQTDEAGSPLPSAPLAPQ